MTPSNVRSDASTLRDLLHRKFKEMGYSIQSEVTIDKTEIDLLARKGGKRLAIEVKATRPGVLSSIPTLSKLRVHPEIDRIYIAAPKSVFTDDIFTIAKYPPIGIGLISIVDNEIEWSSDARETQPARTTVTSYSAPPSVVPKEIFHIKVTFGNGGGKIAKKIEVRCTPLGPFEPLTDQIQTIDELPPEDRAIVDFRFRVKDEVDPGGYFIFMEWSDQISQDSKMVDIKVESRSGKYVEQLVADAVAELNRMASKNIEDLLRQIDDAVENEYLSVEDHIYDKSIWNSLGMAYFKLGLLAQAKHIYRGMLKTLEKYEVSHAVKVHKGLAFHNLGIILYRQGQKNEAKEMFLKAFEEDIRTYGPENASKYPAKKALDELQFDPIS